MDGRTRVWAQRATSCLDTTYACGYTVKTQWTFFARGLGQQSCADHHQGPLLDAWLRKSNLSENAKEPPDLGHLADIPLILLVVF
jgi:hypothetical protein